MGSLLRLFIDDKDLFSGIDFSSLYPYEIVCNKSECNVLCVGIRKNIDDVYLQQFPNVRRILSPSTAIDHIKTSSVKVIYLVPELLNNITASSEFTLLLTLSCLRGLPLAFNDCNYVGEDIFGKTVGILGYGRIGRSVAKYFKVMGAKVIWNDKNLGVSKKNVLRNSDVIIVLVSSVGSNIHFIDFNDFENMVRNPYFINISRGFVVNELALLQALNDGQICGAGLDVVSDVNVFKKYREVHDNLIITNHIAGNTVQSRKKACDFVVCLLAKDRNF